MTYLLWPSKISFPSKVIEGDQPKLEGQRLEWMKWIAFLSSAQSVQVHDLVPEGHDGF
jgi:hypothetical protein